MRPVSSLSDSVTDNDNSGCLDLDEIRAGGMDKNLMEYSDAATALSIRNNGGDMPLCTPVDSLVRDALKEFYENQE
ncbi:MAG: hypothetical protein D3917_18730 [Candidatus Electrothrix sp. AX5]|nr:hypothetical protein [Candidatus Electrothrix sp. AX5]